MGDEPRSDDVVELGSGRFRGPSRWSSRLPGWRPSRGAGAFAVAALVAGLAAGYAVGYEHAPGGPASPARTVTASPSASAPPATFSFANAPALTQDTNACSAQTGTELELGVQVTNQSTAQLTLRAARAVVPTGMLKQVTWQWGPCGALPNGLGQSNEILAPGASTWLTATFKVQVRCPGPAPVQFSVGYLARGHSATAKLPGFPDLSQVPYSGCPPVNTASTFSSRDLAEISWPARLSLASAAGR